MTARRRRWGLPLTAAAVLATGCSPDEGDRLTRGAARAVVSRVLLERAPDAALEPALDCVLANAAPAQVNALAGDAVTGPTASSVQIVAGIAALPATRACLARSGLPALLI